MECILHLGTEKTATSSIQAWLYAQEARLLDQGVAVSHAIGKPNNRDLVAYFQSDFDDWFKDRGILSVSQKKSYFRGFEENLSREIESASKKYNKFVISSEHFHSRLKRQEDIGSLAEYCKKYFDRITLLCYFKEQSVLARGVYSTRLVFGTSESEEEYLKKITPDMLYYNYHRFLTRWEDSFKPDKIEAVIFSEQLFEDGNILKDFAKRCGIQLDSMADSFNQARVNVSLTRTQRTLVRALNTALPRYDKAGRLNRVRTSMVEQIRGLSAPGENRAAFFDTAAIYALFDESNREFAKKFLNVTANPFEPPETVTEDVAMDRDAWEMFEAEMQPVLSGLFGSLLKGPKSLTPKDGDRLSQIARKIRDGKRADDNDALFLLRKALAVHPTRQKLRNEVLQLRARARARG